MKKVTLILGLSLLVLLFGIALGLVLSGQQELQSKSSYNAEEIFELAGNSVFYIRILGENDRASSTGSGVLLSSDGYAMSAYHVVNGSGRMEAIFNDGTVVDELEILAYDESKDVAILKLNVSAIKNVVPLSIRDTPVKHGEEVFAIGFPIKETSIITKGIINTPKAIINGQERMLTSAEIASGMSGGPIIDEEGFLVGMISGSLRTIQNIHLVISPEHIKSVFELTLFEN